MSKEIQKLEDEGTYHDGKTWRYREKVLRRWVREGLAKLSEVNGPEAARRLFGQYLAEVKVKAKGEPSRASQKTVEAVTRALAHCADQGEVNEEYAASLVPLVEVAKGFHPFLTETILRLAGNAGLRRDEMRTEVGRGLAYQRSCNGVAHLAGAKAAETRTWGVVRFMLRETWFGVRLKRALQTAVRAKALFDLAEDSAGKPEIPAGVALSVALEAYAAQQEANRAAERLQKFGPRLWRRDLAKAEAFAKAEKTRKAEARKERSSLPYWKQEGETVTVEFRVRAVGKGGRGRRKTVEIPNPLRRRGRSTVGDEVTVGIGGSLTEEALVGLLGGQARYEEMCRQEVAA